MASFELYIGDDLHNNWIRESLSISEALRVEGRSMSLILTRPKDDPNAVPVEGNLIRLYRLGALEFAGRISTTEREAFGGPEDFHHQVTCIDFTSDFDRHLLQGTIPAGLAGDMVRYLVGFASFGFGVDFVSDGANIQAIEADLEYPSAIMSRISESIEFSWYIDYERQMHFFYIEAIEAPLTDINFDADPAGNPDAVPSDLTEMNDWSQIKNVVWIRGAQAKSSNDYSQTFTPDPSGDQTFFALGYQPWDIESTTITVDAVPQEILLDGVDGVPGDGQGNAGQVYLCIDNWGIRFPDNHPPAPSPSEGGIGADYAFSYDPVIRVEDPESIAYCHEVEDHPLAPSDGIHEVLFQVPQMRVEDESSLWEYGQLILARYAKVRRTITFNSLTQGWAPGQFFRGISVYRGFDTTFYVQTVTKKIWDAQASNPRFMYTITASNLPFPG